MSATCSDVRRCSLIIAALMLACGPLMAQTRLAPAEALHLAFNGADSITRVTRYLSDSAALRAARRAGTSVPTVVTLYLAWSGGRPVGAGYFDADRVRTERALLLFAVDSAGRIRRIEVVAFGEPPEYAPPPRWLAQFTGLDTARVQSGDPVVPLSGATLTTRAVERAARRVLALHEALRPLAGGGTAP